MTPHEAVGLMQDSMSDLIEAHCIRARDGYYDARSQIDGMRSLVRQGPVICAKDRTALEMWILGVEYRRLVDYHKNEIGDDTEPLPPVFALVEAMLKPKPFVHDWDPDRPLATTADAWSEE